MQIYRFDEQNIQKLLPICQEGNDKDIKRAKFLQWLNNLNTSNSNQSLFGSCNIIKNNYANIFCSIIDSLQNLHLL